jgi:hypothetical protein
MIPTLQELLLMLLTFQYVMTGGLFILMYVIYFKPQWFKDGSFGKVAFRLFRNAIFTLIVYLLINYAA